MKSGNFGQDDRMNGMDQAMMEPERVAVPGGNAEWYEYDVYGHSAAWSVSDTIMSPTGPAIATLAYYADAAADWLTEQPIFTMKAMKVMKEMAGMGQPESGKGSSADWRGFTQMDSQAGGFENLRSSAKSADNQDLCNRSRQ